jgi:hypothetical protein
MSIEKLAPETIRENANRNSGQNINVSGDLMRVKEYILVAMCGVALSAGTANAQVIIHTGPPPPVIVERQGPPLHAGWVWVGGYYRWNGGRYVWVPGRWVNPPRRGVVWVPGRWVPRGGGYVWIAGSWR